MSYDVYDFMGYVYVINSVLHFYNVFSKLWVKEFYLV